MPGRVAGKVAFITGRGPRSGPPGAGKLHTQAEGLCLRIQSATNAGHQSSVAPTDFREWTTERCHELVSCVLIAEFLGVTAREDEDVKASAINPCVVRVYPGPASSLGRHSGTGY